VDGLIDFLEPIPNNQPLLSRGSIAWAPVAFLTDTFRQIEFSNSNPVDFFKGFITLKERTAQECLDPGSQVFRHAPIHSEHLRANETYAAVRHKFRLVVILAEVKSYPSFHETIAKELRRRFPSCLLCAPIHSLEGRDGTSKVRPIVLEKLKSYQIPMAFYIGKYPPLRPGIVRFDRTQPIGRDFVKTAKFRLTDDCQEAFDDWYAAYLFGTLRKDSPLHDYWKLLREQNVDLSDAPRLDGI
jgi:hypothetical protein